MTIDTTENRAPGAGAPWVRRAAFAALAVAVPAMGGAAYQNWQTNRAVEDAIYVFRVAEHYCGACHRTLGTWDSILATGDETEGGLYRYLLDMAEAEFMPPSPWHRAQLIEILESRGQ
ncbi:MAG: hypothetical protein AAFX45_00145 [Pseudomonadota bacterium]